MKVPLRLARTAAPPAAADAFLLFASDLAPLADACSRLAHDLPPIFRVRGGFLFVGREGLARPLPGTVRLRRVGADLFVPVDASLLPALLPDEMAALTRNRGLVVLPDRSVLAFDPHAPLPVGRWLAPARVERRAWEPFPSPPDRAERLTLIQCPPPPEAVVEILTAGEPEGVDRLPGAGEPGSASGAPVPDDARPPAGSPLGRIAGGVGMAAGSLFAWLGRVLAVPGLARLGGNLARNAVGRVPRLTERLFGEQEAALREVLRQLQSGDVERGLRRAPAAVPDPSLPSRVGADAALGLRDPRYSLRDLVGSGGGQAVAWLGGGDVWLQLAEEYRRLAREAAARGDHRRAAYVYGMLLRDFRSAANALLAGGLYRDAAILFRDKVKDHLAAADAFEKAGDFDEAVRLLDRLGRYEEAGNLLKRIGDDGRARAYYLRAADALAGHGKWLAAGDLVLKRVNDAPAAVGYYRAGWDADGAEAVTCGLRLLDAVLAAGEWDSAVALLDEGQRRFAPPRAADADRFFNSALRIPGDALPEPLREDLADRTRLLFAEHLRFEATSRKHSAALAGELFGRPTAVWAAPVVRDAAFAAETQSRREKAPAPRLPPPVPVAAGTVTAAAATRRSDDVLIATTTAVVMWRPRDGRVEGVCSVDGATVLGLSASRNGDAVFVLTRTDRKVVLRSFESADGAFHFNSQVDLSNADSGGDAWHLEPLATGWELGVTVAGPSGREMVTGYKVRHAIPTGYLRNGVNTHLLVCDRHLREKDDPEWYWDWDDRFLRCLTIRSETRARWVPQWSPAIPPGSPLSVPVVDWLMPVAGVLEVAGVDADGIVHWTMCDARDVEVSFTRTASSTPPHRFRAVCLISPGLLVAATAGNELLWLRRGDGTALTPYKERTLAVPTRVAALVSRPADREVVAVLDDGSAVRVSNSF